MGKQHDPGGGTAEDESDALLPPLFIHNQPRCPGAEYLFNMSDRTQAKKTRKHPGIALDNAPRAPAGPFPQKPSCLSNFSILHQPAYFTKQRQQVFQGLPALHPSDLPPFISRVCAGLAQNLPKSGIPSRRIFGSPRATADSSLEPWVGV